MIFVGFCWLELTTTCLPIMLSYTSAFSPIMALSITEELVTMAFLLILVKLSMHESAMRTPSSIWQCLPISTAPSRVIFFCFIFWIVSLRRFSESPLSPWIQMQPVSLSLPPKSFRVGKPP